MPLGPIYFAWIDPAETFDPGIHAREDEDMLALSLSQAEGEFVRAELELPIRGWGSTSPRAGPGGPGETGLALGNLTDVRARQPTARTFLTATQQEGGYHLRALAPGELPDPALEDAIGLTILNPANGEIPVRAPFQAAILDVSHWVAGGSANVTASKTGGDSIGALTAIQINTVWVRPRAVGGLPGTSWIQIAPQSETDDYRWTTIAGTLARAAGMAGGPSGRCAGSAPSPPASSPAPAWFWFRAETALWHA